MVSQKSCALFGEICRDDVPVVGGKGANLGDMVQVGLPVPPGFVICAPAYREVVRNCDLEARIEGLLAGVDPGDSAQLQEVEGSIRRLFEDVPITGELRRSIVESYRSLGDDAPVAVRSSATAEDLAGASFAGQLETYLNVVGEAELLDAVRRCWSSLFTSRVIFYRHQRGFGDVKVSMAVLVQKMIDPEKSGVTFTVDPVLRNHYQMVIEAVWGLGEGIVSGAITPDHYKMDRETCEITYEFVPEKRIMFCKNCDGGVIEADVPPAKVSARILTDDELRQLVDLGNRIEQHFGCPQDIEWCIEGDEVYILQSRPITNL